MVPGFMFVAGVAGLASLLILLHQYANKVAFAKKWQKALHSSGTENELMHELHMKAEANGQET